jgi:mRNA-degrading endonuclease toxin of MazEF toxin-antitoxin module
MMKYKYKGWFLLKNKINANSSRKNFREGEIWMVHLGFNIGDEQNGRGPNFIRPILVLRKYNKNIFMAIPIVGRYKEGYYYLNYINKRSSINCVVFSQMRVLDTKRLVYRKQKLNSNLFKEIKKKARHMV